MTVDEMKARAAELEREIEAALTTKEAAMAEVDSCKALVAELRAELDPLNLAIAKLGDLDPSTLALLQGASNG